MNERDMRLARLGPGLLMSLLALADDLATDPKLELMLMRGDGRQATKPEKARLLSKLYRLRQSVCHVRAELELGPEEGHYQELG